MVDDAALEQAARDVAVRLATRPTRAYAACPSPKPGAGARWVDVAMHYRSISSPRRRRYVPVGMMLSLVEESTNGRHSDARLFFHQPMSCIRNNDRGHVRDDEANDVRHRRERHAGALSGFAD